MFRLFKTIRQAEKATTNVNEKVLVKLNALLDDVGELLEKLENDGVELTLDVAGEKMPIKINLDLGQQQKPEVSVIPDSYKNPAKTKMQKWLEGLDN